MTASVPLSLAPQPPTHILSNEFSSLIHPEAPAAPPPPQPPPHHHHTAAAATMGWVLHVDSFEEAQSAFPHNAAILVGNLDKKRTSEELVHAVQGQFSRRYGPCWVKVGPSRRNVPKDGDSAENPWAIVQFPHPDQAQTAISETRQIRVMRDDSLPMVSWEVGYFLQGFGPFQIIYYDALVPDGSGRRGHKIEFLTIGDFNASRRVLPRGNASWDWQMVGGIPLTQARAYIP
ncbi:hypothetical protein Q7P37_006534 [Cladosporium fusiforme]